MLNPAIITLGKLFSKTTQTLNLGHGSTWPGHIALNVNKHFIRDIIKRNDLKTIVVAGTNGKTTTTTLLRTIFEHSGEKVLQNHSGANLLNGIASTLLLSASPQGKLQETYAIFEVDENTLPLLLKELTPDAIVILNLFRDQLDRYGEVHTIAHKWKQAFEKLSDKTHIFLNADDPLVAYLGKEEKQVTYFGLAPAKSAKQIHEHAVDSVYCPQCGEKLHFHEKYFSHLGKWECKKCGLTRPQITTVEEISSPLLGDYNTYNVQAATLVAKHFGISHQTTQKAIQEFKPAFGRQEVLVYKDRKIQLFLSKNPTGFNASLRALTEAKAHHVLFVLNDRIPDGRDISWIWDVEFEEYIKNFKNITVSGDRCFDLALRMKYADQKVEVIEDLGQGINQAIEKTALDETLYILPTYSAMLETRKILTGKKIL